MNHLAKNVLSRMSAARRNAESLMPSRPPQTAETALKQELEHARQEMAAKTERLRELRLAKEALDVEAAGPQAVRQKKLQRRRIKRF
jgi:hypothetical protein